MEKDKKLDVMKKTVSTILLATLLAIALALPTLILWNLIMPAVFGAVKINFFQALGIKLLADVLFNGVLAKGIEAIKINLY